MALFKIAATAILDNFQWLTIYLSSAHRAVIFAIAQLSCILYCSSVPTVIVAMLCVIVSINHYLSIHLDPSPSTLTV